MLNEVDGTPDRALRVVIEPGGCHGFQYRLELDNQVNEDDVWVHEINANIRKEVLTGISPAVSTRMDPEGSSSIPPHWTWFPDPPSTLWKS